MHKFAADDRVVIHIIGTQASVRPGLYVVVKPLPMAATGPVYQVRSALDEYDAVIEERWMKLTRTL
jgi:hypothetical protein